MKRLISAERIAALLMPHGFALAADWGASDIVYSRPSELPELWEQISVGIGGKQGEETGIRVRSDPELVVCEVRLVWIMCHPQLVLRLAERLVKIF